MTPTQRRYLQAIQDFIDADGWYPAVDDITAALGYSSCNGTHEVLERLERDGLIEWPWSVLKPSVENGKRSRATMRRPNSIRLTEQGKKALQQ
jgi:Mn-dependent DtxR family transcriptional regulator